MKMFQLTRGVFVEARGGSARNTVDAVQQYLFKGQ